MVSLLRSSTRTQQLTACPSRSKLMKTMRYLFLAILPVSAPYKVEDFSTTCSPLWLLAGLPREAPTRLARQIRIQELQLPQTVPVAIRVHIQRRDPARHHLDLLVFNGMFSMAPAAVTPTSELLSNKRNKTKDNSRTATCNRHRLYPTFCDLHLAERTPPTTLPHALTLTSTMMAWVGPAALRTAVISITTTVARFTSLIEAMIHLVETQALTLVARTTIFPRSCLPCATCSPVCSVSLVLKAALCSTFLQRVPRAEDRAANGETMCLASKGWMTLSASSWSKRKGQLLLHLQLRTSSKSSSGSRWKTSKGFKRRVTRIARRAKMIFCHHQRRTSRMVVERKARMRMNSSKISSRCLAGTFSTSIASCLG